MDKYDFLSIPFSAAEVQCEKKKTYMILEAVFEEFQGTLKKKKKLRGKKKITNVLLCVRLNSS